jgi:hypothetical protein
LAHLLSPRIAQEAGKKRHGWPIKFSSTSASHVLTMLGGRFGVKTVLLGRVPRW